MLNENVDQTLACGRTAAPKTKQISMNVVNCSCYIFDNVAAAQAPVANTPIYDGSKVGPHAHQIALHCRLQASQRHQEHAKTAFDCGYEVRVVQLTCLAGQARTSWSRRAAVRARTQICSLLYREARLSIYQGNLIVPLALVCAIAWLDTDTNEMQIVCTGLAYVLFSVVLLFLAIFGQNPCFSGTFVEQLAVFASGGWFSVLLCAPHLLRQIMAAVHLYRCPGARVTSPVSVPGHSGDFHVAICRPCACGPVTPVYTTACRRLVDRLCGRHAAKKLMACEDSCCATRNPVLATLYILLLAGSFWVYNRYVFALLPTPLSASWHRCATCRLHTRATSALTCNVPEA
jgi:hypothetical protein